MKIHEYQAKELLKEYGIKTGVFELVQTKEQIAPAVEKIGAPCVVKAQVHSGARGKSGGIKFAKTQTDAIALAGKILGMDFSSHQLAGEVKKVNKIIIEKAVNIDKEYYLSLVSDRKTKSVAVIFSTQGGMDIEEVAKNSPKEVVTGYLDVSRDNDFVGITQCYNVSSFEKIALAEIAERLFKLFIEKDCSLVEINPLVLTKEGGFSAVDAKINFDDAALFRHPEILELRDIAEENPLEVEASKFDLNYIKLDGTIGCMVNGAGLAMATMDVIKLAGKTPANFLDVGGGADAEKIENAFRILLSDRAVKAVFINIFGGILRCDVLAEGIQNALKNLKVDLPVIVRLEGTNKEEGAEILAGSGLKFSVVKDLAEAQKVIERL